MSQGPNLYEYCLNDPIDRIDPFGLCPCGQHLEFDPATFNATMNTMTGGTAGKITGGAYAASQMFASATGKFNPYVRGYGVAATLGAIIGSYRCVADGPNTYYPPDTSNVPAWGPAETGVPNYPLPPTPSF
jgi:hypothetical protein